MIGRGQSEPTGHIPFTPRAREGLEQSLQAALALEHSSITEDHILFGTMQAGGSGGVAAKALKQLGVQAEEIAEAVKAHLAAEGPAEDEEGDPVTAALEAFQQTIGGTLDVPYPELKAAMHEALRAAQAAAAGLTRAA